MKRFIFYCNLILVTSVQAMEEREAAVDTTAALAVVDQACDDRGMYESFLFAPSKSDVINLIQKVRVPISKPHIALNVLRNNNLQASDLTECIGMLCEQEQEIENKEILDVIERWVSLYFDKTPVSYKQFIDDKHCLNVKGYCHILNQLAVISCGYLPGLPKQKMCIFAITNGAELFPKPKRSFLMNRPELPACMLKLIEIRLQENIIPIVTEKKNEVISPQYPLCVPKSGEVLALPGQ